MKKGSPNELLTTKGIYKFNDMASIDELEFPLNCVGPIIVIGGVSQLAQHLVRQLPSDCEVAIVHIDEMILYDLVDEALSDTPSFYPNEVCGHQLEDCKYTTPSLAEGVLQNHVCKSHVYIQVRRHNKVCCRMFLLKAAFWNYEIEILNEFILAACEPMKEKRYVSTMDSFPTNQIYPIMVSHWDELQVFGCLDGIDDVDVDPVLTLLARLAGPPPRFTAQLGGGSNYTQSETESLLEQFNEQKAMLYDLYTTEFEKRRLDLEIERVKKLGDLNTEKRLLKANIEFYEQMLNNKRARVKHVKECLAERKAFYASTNDGEFKMTKALDKVEECQRKYKF